MKISGKALAWAAAIGTILQVTMVTTGHTNAAVARIFAVGGMGISGIAGIIYTVVSTEVLLGDNMIAGAIAGAVCAFIGILISVLLGDVPATLLVIGTASSAVTGAAGAWIGRLFSSGRV